MAKVSAQMAMSIDGFIAHEDDTIDGLFGWYFDGPVEVQSFGGMAFKLSEPSAKFFKDALDSIGAFVMGRRLYEHTNGWNAKPPAEAPLVVPTHNPPSEWPQPEGGVPITFKTTIEEAVEEAKRLAGDKVVSVAGSVTAREVLAAGLLDEIVISQVPIVLGAGLPWFAGTKGAPFRLSDPEVIEAPGVTHLRYQVIR
jgi:dihydrofolate reductase